MRERVSFTADFLMFNMRQEHSLTAFLPSPGSFSNSQVCLFQSQLGKLQNLMLGRLEWSSLLPQPCFHPIRWQRGPALLKAIYALFGSDCLLQGHQHPLVQLERHSYCGMFLLSVDLEPHDSSAVAPSRPRYHQKRSQHAYWHSVGVLATIRS